MGLTMKFLIIAAAAALAIQAEKEEPMEETQLAEVDASITEFPQDEELDQVTEDETNESWRRLYYACRRLKAAWYEYKHYGYSIRRKFYAASRKRIHGRTL